MRVLDEMVVAVSFTIASIPIVDFGWLNSIRFIDARNGFRLEMRNPPIHTCVRACVGHLLVNGVFSLDFLSFDDGWLVS